MIQDISQRIHMNNGQKIPGYGFGLYKTDNDELIHAVAVAFGAGYRLFDTAAYYKNEESVSIAIRNLPRAEIFLISKIWPTQFHNPVQALDTSLDKLQQDYLDGYLLHWPGTNMKSMLKTWEILLKEQEKGKIRTLGTSNFLQTHLEAIHNEFNMWPAIDQLEIHPSFQQPALCNFCKEKQIAVMAWSPLGRGSALTDKVIDDIAIKVGKSAAQVILRWHVQLDRIPIPKSVHDQRIDENADVFDFSLTDAQMAAISSLDKGTAGRRGADPMTFAG